MSNAAIRANGAQRRKGIRAVRTERRWKRTLLRSRALGQSRAFYCSQRDTDGRIERFNIFAAPVLAI